jgi:hypothetical protein
MWADSEAKQAALATEGQKLDHGKAPISLINRRAIEEEAQVMAFGARKYAAHNWRKGIAASRLLDAALRHIFAYADGEDNDPETGLSHLAHARCCLAFQIDLQHTHPELDDRHVFKARDNLYQSNPCEAGARNSLGKNEQPVFERDAGRVVQREQGRPLG